MKILDSLSNLVLTIDTQRLPTTMETSILAMFRLHRAIIRKDWRLSANSDKLEMAMVSTFARIKKHEALMSTKAIGRPISVKDKAAAFTIMVTFT